MSIETTFEDEVTRLTRDLKNSAKVLTSQEARFLVDAYYTMQDNRIRSAAQVRALTQSGEPHSVLIWLEDQNMVLENQVKRALDAYSGANAVGAWARNQVGIGPVISAGLLAHIDIKKAPTVGHIWSFAGLNPDAQWEKGKKRPWNAALKTLCWKIGESFVKVSNNEKAFYGHLYKEKKDYYTAKNEAGDYKEQAEQILLAKKFDKTTDAYKAYSQGKLPLAQIHARAKRYAVKIFLSHLHHVWYVHEFKTEPPKPFALAHLDLVHMIEVPE